jgi:hypothetical protein
MPWDLFEGHWFHRLTRGVYTDRYPHLSYPTWTKKFYKGGRGEYDRLIEAIGLGDEPDPALKSASWGLFQIMGFNHELAGFPDVRSFANAMATSEGAQLDAFVSFVLAQPIMAEHLREKKWAEFAKRYNGPGYQQNQYDTKLAAEFTRARQQMTEAVIGESLATERGDTAAIQSARAFPETRGAARHRCRRSGNRQPARRRSFRLRRRTRNQRAGCQAGRGPQRMMAEPTRHTAAPIASQ